MADSHHKPHVRAVSSVQGGYLKQDRLQLSRTPCPEIELTAWRVVVLIVRKVFWLLDH